MKTITTTVYPINEHPNPSKVYEWIRENWHDVNDHARDELIASLTALRDRIGGELSYGISTVPDRGEYISFQGYDKEALMDLKPEDCPLTGAWTDYDVIEALQKGNIMTALYSLHDDTEDAYSDDSLYDLCIANDYHFTEAGEFYG